MASRSRKGWLLVLGLLGMSCTTPAWAERLIIYYENRPPYTVFSNGALGGMLGKPAMQALRQLDVELSLQEVPFNRHMALIDKNLQYACAVGRFKTAARLANGKFSQAIYRDQPYVAVVRADNLVLQGLQSFESLLRQPGLRFVFSEGYSYGEQLDGWIANSRANIVRVPESNANLARMVYRHMVDVTFFSGEEAEALLAAMPEERPALQIRRFPDGVPGALRYFYCSKQVDDKLLHKLDAAIATLKLGL